MPLWRQFRRRGLGWLLALVLWPVLGATLAHAQSQDTIINPQRSGDAVVPTSRPREGANTYLLLAAVVAAAAGGWMLWRQRHAPRGATGRNARKLSVVETCSLGNRQYLVVADYNGSKFLLGVCPGRVDMLSPLDGPERPKAP